MNFHVNDEKIIYIDRCAQCVAFRNPDISPNFAANMIKGAFCYHFMNFHVNDENIIYIVRCAQCVAFRNPDIGPNFAVHVSIVATVLISFLNFNNNYSLTCAPSVCHFELQTVV